MSLQYAKVVWTAADVQSLAPRLTDDEAEKWLKQNETHIQDRLIEVGWEVITSLLADDGIDTSDVDEGEYNDE